MHYFRSVLVGLLLLSSLLLTACSESKPINIAYHSWVGYVMPFLNDLPEDFPSLYYRKTSNAQETMQLFESGEIDMGYLTLDEVLTLKSKSVNLKVILVTDSSAGADVVLAQPDIQTREDIIGKKLAYEPHALGALMLHFFLQKYDLKKEQLNLIAMPINEQPAAFEAKQLDIAITYHPSATEITQQPYNELFNSREIPNTILDVLAVRADALDQNSDTICQAVHAHLQGVERLKDNPQDSKYRLASILQIDQQQFVQSLAGLGIPSAEVNYPLLKKNGAAMQVAEKLLPILKETGSVKNNVDTHSLFYDQCILGYLE